MPRALRIQYSSASARRLRLEPTVTLEWIAAELHMGTTWTQVGNLLAQIRVKQIRGVEK